MCNSINPRYGANPVVVNWRVVRGDTSTLTVEFLEADETTQWDTENWYYVATAYDPSGNVLDELFTETDGSKVTIIAPASTTMNWGTAYKSVVAELSFDLQVEIVNGNEHTIWTPIVGNIIVLGDVTPGGSL